MIIELIAVGLFVGAISGFFGVGGGMLLNPILLTIGFDIKSAIAISVVQMVLSSINGSYINYKKGILAINDGIWVGIGGILGAILGSYFTDIMSPNALKITLFSITLFALLRIYFSKPYDENREANKIASYILFFIGFFIGVIAMMLGIGGSVLLMPILVGFLHYSTKNAATAGLFFVVFSSLTGLIYRVLNNTFDKLHLNIEVVLAVAVSAIFGVVIGIKFKDRVSHEWHKKLLVLMYLVILALLIRKIWF